MKESGDIKSGWKNFRDGMQSKWHRFLNKSESAENIGSESSSGITDWSSKSPASPTPETPKNNNPNISGQLGSDIKSDFSSRDEGLY